jgi:hypothetical protein
VLTANMLFWSRFTSKHNVKKYWNIIWMEKYLMMNLFQEIKNT